MRLATVNAKLLDVQIVKAGRRYAVAYKERGSWNVYCNGGGWGTGITPEQALVGAYYDKSKPVLFDTIGDALIAAKYDAPEEAPNV